MIRYLIKIILELLWWDWQHVGIFEAELTTGPNYDRKTWAVFIHCYESRWGTRRTSVQIQRAGYFNWTSYSRIRRYSLYQTEIIPWLHGRLHDKIPSYQKVKGGKWDFLKKLKGETPIVLNDDEK